MPRNFATFLPYHQDVIRNDWQTFDLLKSILGGHDAFYMRKTASYTHMLHMVVPPEYAGETIRSHFLLWS
jgi:hypothetical protein